MRTVSLALAALGLAAVGTGVGAQTKTATPSARPPPSAQTLARNVAAHDDFLALVGMTATGQIAGVEHKLGDLTPAEKAKVDAIGEAKLVEGENRVIDRLAQVYAAKFTLGELRAMSAFLETPAGKIYSGRLVNTLPALGESMKGFDFQREMLKETCAQLNKGCVAAAPPR